MLPNMMKFAALEQKTHEVIASASRKIEQEAEADTADDQAREHDLVNTSAPMPANPKHIDITISIAIHSHIFCKHASKHDEVCSVGAKNHTK